MAISRTGSSHSTHDERRYDVWGSVRAGSSTGAPAGRYCGNLGHQQDDESGLIYMRARYYEPGSGRFISQNPAKDGINWYVYCGNDALNFVDSSGNTTEPFPAFAGLAGLILGLLAFGADAFGGSVAALYCAQLAVGCFAIFLGAALQEDPYRQSYGDNSILSGLKGYLIIGSLTALYTVLIKTVLKGVKAGQRSSAAPVVELVGLEMLAILGAMWAIDSAGA